MASPEFKKKVLRTLALKGYPVIILAGKWEKDEQSFHDLMACIEKKTTGFFKKSFEEAVDECAKQYL